MILLPNYGAGCGGGYRHARRERGGSVGTKLDTRNNRDFGDAMIRAVFDEVSGAI